MTISISMCSSCFYMQCCSTVQCSFHIIKSSLIQSVFLIRLMKLTFDFYWANSKKA